MVAAKKKTREPKEPWERRRPKPTIKLPPTPVPAPVVVAPRAELVVKEPALNPDLVTDLDLCRVLKAVAVFDPARLLRTDGSSVELSEIDYYTRIAIAGLEMAEFYGPGENEDGRGVRVNLGVLKKFKLTDRFKAIELLWRYEGKLRDDAPQMGQNAGQLLPPVVNINFVAVKAERVQ